MAAALQHEHFEPRSEILTAAVARCLPVTCHGLPCAILCLKLGLFEPSLGTQSHTLPKTSDDAGTFEESLEGWNDREICEAFPSDV